jgi:hypothetical protein
MISLEWKLEIESVFSGEPAAVQDDGHIVVYQAVREGLINAAKHARCESVQVRVGVESGSVTVLVEDDGVGMTPKGSGGPGFGLTLLRERVERVNGIVNIDTDPEMGTRLRVEIPLEPRPQAGGSSSDRKSVNSSSGRHRPAATMWLPLLLNSMLSIGSVEDSQLGDKRGFSPTASRVSR